MAVGVSWDRTGASGLNGPCRARSCVFMKPMARAVVVLRAVSFKFMFLFGEAWEAEEQRSDHLCLAAMSQPWCQ